MSLQWEIKEKFSSFLLLFNGESIPQYSGLHEAFKHLEIPFKFRRYNISLCMKFFVWPQNLKFLQIYINFHEKYRFRVNTKISPKITQKGTFQFLISNQFIWYPGGRYIRNSPKFLKTKISLDGKLSVFLPQNPKFFRFKQTSEEYKLP